MLISPGLVCPTSWAAISASSCYLCIIMNSKVVIPLLIRIIWKQTNANSMNASGSVTANKIHEMTITAKKFCQFCY